MRDNQKGGELNPAADDRRRCKSFPSPTSRRFIVVVQSSLLYLEVGRKVEEIPREIRPLITKM